MLMKKFLPKDTYSEEAWFFSSTSINFDREEKLKFSGALRAITLLKIDTKEKFISFYEKLGSSIENDFNKISVFDERLQSIDKELQKIINKKPGPKEVLSGCKKLFTELESADDFFQKLLTSSSKENIWKGNVESIINGWRWEEAKNPPAFMLEISSSDLKGHDKVKEFNEYLKESNPYNAGGAFTELFNFTEQGDQAYEAWEDLELCYSEFIYRCLYKQMNSLIDFVKTKK